MNSIFRLETVADYNNLIGMETLHPLVSVVDLSKINPSPSGAHYTHLNFGIYAVYLKESDCGEVRYGRCTYDYQEGTLLFIAPGQVIQITRRNPDIPQKGWVLLFHPDLIHGTSLGRHISEYNFFSYQIHEALHISERERMIVYDSLSRISCEIEQRMDKHSKKLIVNTIQLFLDYCIRFYDRQFISRETLNKGTIERFEKVLDEYFKTDQPKTLGLPSVSYIAEKMNLSANYFGDLVKRETGKTPHEYIQLKLVNIAKDRIFDSSKSISEIAYGLGFKYPQHFTRMFKKQVGMSPVDFRLLN